MTVETTSTSRTWSKPASVMREGRMPSALGCVSARPSDVHQLVAHALAPVDGGARDPGLASGDRQDTGVRVDTDDTGRRFDAVQQQGLGAGAAADVDDHLCRPRSHVHGQQAAPEPLPDQGGHGVVEAGGGEPARGGCERTGGPRGPARPGPGTGGLRASAGCFAGRGHDGSVRRPGGTGLVRTARPGPPPGARPGRAHPGSSAGQATADAGRAQCEPRSRRTDRARRAQIRRCATAARVSLTSWTTRAASSGLFTTSVWFMSMTRTSLAE